MKKILTLIIVLCFIIYPFNIYAELPDYIEPITCTNIASYTLNSNTYYVHVIADSGVRVGVSWSSGNYLRLINGSLSSGKYLAIAYDTNSACTLTIKDRQLSTSSNVLDTNNQSTVIWYVSNVNGSSGRNHSNVQSNYVNITSNFPTGQNLYNYLFPYGGQEQNQYGLLNIRFNTDINTHDAGDNQDNISWTAWDSNGNYIGDKQIEIRAVPGYYEAQDKPSLLQLKFINWVRESNLEVQLYKGSVLPEYKTFTWNYVAGLFSSIKTWQGRFWSIFASDDYWYQYGWIYEARILDTDDTPLSEWQEIVTGTASSPKDTEIIETSDELTPELYNVIYNINVYNDYQENWQINNTTINMQPDETLDNDKPWWVVLLEGILSILDKLLELLMKLFIPENLTLPDFTNQTNQYMNNTGIFGQSIQFINDTHTTFQSIQNADPVISVPAITYDNTTLIPAQSWNLNTLVDDYGLSNLHNMVYLVTDGFVYIGLIILIRRKVIEVLKK